MHPERREPIRELHLPNLLAAVNKMEKIHENGIPIFVFDSLMPRSDSPKIFDEGKKFSGISREGQAESTVTIVASPHAPTTVDRDLFISAATDTFGIPSQLPQGLNQVVELPPELMVWWRRLDDIYPDFADIFMLDEIERNNFLSLISSQIEKSVTLLNYLGYTPIIGGSWGNGTPLERAKYGLSRGGPTNRIGHTLVAAFEEEKISPATQVSVDIRSRLNHFAPWVIEFQDIFGSEIAKIISDQIKEYLDNPTGSSASVYRKIINGENGGKAILDGYLIEFSQPVALEEVIGSLVSVAGRFESLYQNVYSLYEDYSKGNSEALSSVSETIVNFGLSKPMADELSAYIGRIRPTLGQLLAWEDDLYYNDSSKDIQTRIRIQKEKYERINLLLKEKVLRTREALVYDMTRSPSEYKDITMTWPVHSSFCYMIDDFSGNEDIVVHSFKMFPLISTTESFIERTWGGILSRKLS